MSPKRTHHHHRSETVSFGDLSAKEQAGIIDALLEHLNLRIQKDHYSSHGDKPWSDVSLQPREAR